VKTRIALSCAITGALVALTAAPSNADFPAAKTKADAAGDAPKAADILSTYTYQRGYNKTYDNPVPEDGLVTFEVAIKRLTERTVVRWILDPGPYGFVHTFTVSRQNRKTRLVFDWENSRQPEVCPPSKVRWDKKADKVTVEYNRRCDSWNGLAYDGDRYRQRVVTLSGGRVGVEDRAKGQTLEWWSAAEGT
jgi:hypothetical protein